jgi:predicted outer membrane repeat protein
MQCGGTCSSLCSASFTNCTFILHLGCKYGAVFLQTTRSSFRNCTFHLNTADSGGAISATSCAVSVDDCSFSSNSALSYGGAIDLNSATKCPISRSTFTNNSAVGGHGGAVAAFAVTNFSVIDCHLSHNRASSNGGCKNVEGESSGITVYSRIFHIILLKCMGRYLFVSFNY